MDRVTPGDGAGGGAPGPASCDAPRNQQPERPNRYWPMLTGIVLGSVLEWYDFSAAVLLEGPLEAAFFPPAAPPAVRQLQLYIVYLLSFLARPLGALLFGSVADRWGRRAALLTTILGIGAATTLIGCLPTYATAGAAAPALLAAARVAVGLSVGAEYTTAIVFVNEAAPPQRKALHSGLLTSCAGAGSVIAAVVVLATMAAVTQAQLNAWGWRVPFLLAAPATLAAAWLRKHLHDPEEWLAASAARKHAVAVARHAGRTAGSSTPSGGLGSWHHSGGGGSSSAERSVAGARALVVGVACQSSSKDATVLHLSVAPAQAGGKPDAGAACGSVACCAFHTAELSAALGRSPLGQLLQEHAGALGLHVIYCAWLSSALFTVYVWLPATLRASGTAPLMTHSITLCALVLETAFAIAAAWVSPRLPRLLLLQAAAVPLVTGAVVAGMALTAAHSVAAAWAAVCIPFSLVAILMGTHGATFPYLYGASHRSTGLSLAYSLGAAAGGAAPAVSAALRLAMGGSGSGADGGVGDPAHYAAAIWLAALALPAAAALLALRRVAPRVDTVAGAHAWAAAAAAAAVAAAATEGAASAEFAVRSGDAWPGSSRAGSRGGRSFGVARDCGVLCCKPGAAGGLGPAVGALGPGPPRGPAP